ncbi:hypothetical protein ACLKA7_005464, partial [Drosophila subpalustris]
GKHRSVEQEKILLDFMKENNDIACGFTKGDKVDILRKWRELTTSLNAAGPPCKTMDGWKKAWTDWNDVIMSKMTNNRR